MAVDLSLYQLNFCILDTFGALLNRASAQVGLPLNEFLILIMLFIFNIQLYFYLWCILMLTCCSLVLLGLLHTHKFEWWIVYAEITHVGAAPSAHSAEKAFDFSRSPADTSPVCSSIAAKNSIPSSVFFTLSWTSVSNKNKGPVMQHSLKYPQFLFGLYCKMFACSILKYKHVDKGTV